jgi:Raf kinase inhibitor-like YbhB/YbcL family protein
MKKIYVLIISMILISVFSFSGNLVFNCKTDKMKSNIIVNSKAFTESEMIPTKYTCDAENVSPPISWTKGPDSTKTYVLICDDPDAPSKVWVHWVLYNIPSDIQELSENFKTGNNNSKIKSGVTDFGTPEYSGPCPPSGVHHYKFKVYALDCELNLKAGASKAEVEAAMKDHILADGVLTGTYKRK